MYAKHNEFTKAFNQTMRSDIINEHIIVNKHVQPILHILRRTSSGHSLYILSNQFVQHIYKYYTCVQTSIPAIYNLHRMCD